MEPTPEARAEAKCNAGGWVYAIDERYDPNDAIPPEGIKGAWKVDDQGDIEGEFVPNPRYASVVPKPPNQERDA